MHSLLSCHFTITKNSYIAIHCYIWAPGLIPSAPGLGIGRFTIVDDATVCEADLGVNFFLDDTCVGKSRAECTYHHLSELNPDVQGAYINDVCLPLPVKDFHKLSLTS